MKMLSRPRRNRKSTSVRDLVCETVVTTKDLVEPLFIVDGVGKKSSINSMPGIYRYSLDEVLKKIERSMELGLNTFALFPSLEESLKDSKATESTNKEGLFLRALRNIKERFPECCIISDVAMDPYSSDGHDGIVVEGEILNDETLPILASMAVAQAQAGADIIGPSDMMDGRVGFIRSALDESGYKNVSIMSYTAKYASQFYGPFREALDSEPKFGDKKTYQMNPANKREALRESFLDVEEGADFLMVKPALCYLDIIHLLKDEFHLPIAAYNVSGEYAMIKASAEKGYLNEKEAMIEVLTSIKRAGADIILSYFASDMAKTLKNL